MLGLNWADWALIVVVLISALISLNRGFIKEVVSLIIWLFAIVLSVIDFRGNGQSIELP